MSKQIEVQKRTNAITMETEYTVWAHGTEIRVKADKYGVKISDLRITNAAELETYAIVMSKAWAQYLKVRPSIEVVDKVPEHYEEPKQQELPRVLS